MKGDPLWCSRPLGVTTSSSAKSPPERSDGYSVQLESADFTSGGLNQSSRIRPNRLFTAEEGIVVYRAGHVSDGKLNQALDHLIDILRQP